MTTGAETRSAPRVLGRPQHPSALSRLINVDRQEFAEAYWGRRALLCEAGTLPGGFEDLLDEGAVDELVSRRGLRTPFLRVAKSGSTLPERGFTAPGGVGAGIGDQVSDDRLARVFADGSTLVLQALHRTWAPVLEFCGTLAEEFGHPVQANAYITPPQNQGFADHYDVHDVFVLQVSGEKQWSIHEPVLPAPLRDQPWSDRRADVQQRAAEPTVLEAVLRPGDCLYLPRGFLHAARALGGISAHLTIGVHVWTRYGLAEQLVQRALDAVAADANIRRSLPLGTRFTDGVIGGDVEDARAALIDALRHVSPAAIESSMAAASRGAQRAAPIGPLRQFRSAASLTAESVIVVRDHLAPRLEPVAGGGAVLRSRAQDLAVSAAESSVLAGWLADGSATAGALGMELARRLVLAGLAVVE